MTPPNAGETDYEVTQGGGQWEGKKQLSLAITRRPFVIDVSVNKHNLFPMSTNREQGSSLFFSPLLYIHFSTFLLSNYYVLSTELDFGDTKMNKELTVVTWKRERKKMTLDFPACQGSTICLRGQWVRFQQVMDECSYALTGTLPAIGSSHLWSQAALKIGGGW